MKLNTPVSEVMTQQIIAVNPSQKLKDIKQLFDKGDFHYNFPVVENNELKGIVVLTDFMFAIRLAENSLDNTDYSNLTIKEIMHENVLTVSPAATIAEVARLFSDNQHHTVMITEQGQLRGIVSSGDIIRWLVKMN